MERRLAAILAADMAGYSRLMEADEDGIISRQKAHRRELIDPEIERNRGHIVKTTGDGMLVEFASAQDAVRSAIDIQAEMQQRERDRPEDERIQYRVGINVGDVVFDNGASARSYSAQLLTRYFVLYLGCTLDLIPRSWPIYPSHREGLAR